MAELYKFNDNGVYYCFTPGLEDVVFESRTYRSTKMKRGAITLTDNFSKATLDIKFERNNSFSKRLIKELPENYILFTLYKDGLPYWQGRVTHTTTSKTSNNLICESLFAARAKGGSPWKITPQCNHSLYSPQCGVIKALWEDDYTVVASSKILTIPAIVKPTGYYDYGVAEMFGQKRTIIKQDGTTIYLDKAFTGVLSGDITLVPGCRLTPTACTGFNNLDNFMGFNHLPAKNPFDSTGLL